MPNFTTLRQRRIGMLVPAFAIASIVGFASLTNAASQGTVNQYRISKQVVASGGARATGGQYALVGTVAQAVTGRTEQGDTLLQHGFHANPDNRPELLFQSNFEELMRK